MPTRARGFTLLETLVALLVLSFGVMGLIALQGRALQYAVDAEDRNRAALLADELVSLMWLSRTVTLPSATVASWTAQVQNAAASGLPQASATVSDPDALGVVTITIRWRPPSRKAASGDLVYSTKVVVP
ncbi:type IV pilus modification protein PilV [uncultured Sphaerotilus sp.]|uniref:type IV pilus modification protein PilV n=1 Tax=uncultured Sphaerotilus sp. TaxID=474984 RepID=UPI0030CA1D65